jgi:hypothetical protein
MPRSKKTGVPEEPQDPEILDQSTASDDAPEDDRPQRRPGGAGSWGVPSSEDFYVTGQGGGNVWNAAKEVITMPFDDPSAYLPRGILTEQYLKAFILMDRRRRRMYTGFSDTALSDLQYIAGTPAIGGVARNQFVQIVSGEQRMNFAQRGVAGLQNIGDRIKDVTNRQAPQQ